MDDDPDLIDNDSGSWLGGSDGTNLETPLTKNREIVADIS
jgi:hypothetical protein